MVVEPFPAEPLRGCRRRREMSVWGPMSDSDPPASVEFQFNPTLFVCTAYVRYFILKDVHSMLLCYRSGLQFPISFFFCESFVKFCRHFQKEKKNCLVKQNALLHVFRGYSNAFFVFPSPPVQSSAGFRCNSVPNPWMCVSLRLTGSKANAARLSVLHLPSACCV